jgi:hypothetical protein
MFAFREWLYAPRTDGQPRALRLPLSARNTFAIVEDIKKVKITEKITKITCLQMA